MIRIEATYPSGRTEIHTAKTMREAIAKGNQLKALGCAVKIKELPKR